MASKEGGIINFLKAVKREIEKTTWPTSDKVQKAIAAVAVIVLIYALLTGVFDFLIGLVMQYVLQV
ncbi:preprotein translocase subunit SecE [Proteiniclasticum sp. QWL-01]|uniref:preprotein translocase subunit SecE n=1 Tax=Proteiniclasticum sp. QWL-01 TaxID=3036945 RepID=UPI00220CCED4|nr:preprotein translocase subunit SecE [Proteiniclasticum sp. QWL-01]UUM11746.1 preprotein translocase subunit SecE [Clostridiaceae bacterium HFYG-1003]WFF73230.1 preprotein translocase subunit SecE [Proteiniclasticum sp. QWL-01]